MKTAPHLGQQVQGHETKGIPSVAKTTRTDAAAAKERWIQEQMKHFPPGSMDGFIRQLRAYERAARERAGRGVAA